MKYSAKVSDAVHILVYIRLNSSRNLTTDDVEKAMSDASPAYVRQLMAKMKTGKLIVSARVHATIMLARPDSQITLYDIYRAVETGKPLTRLDTIKDPDCSISSDLENIIHIAYNRVHSAAVNEMKSITLYDIVNEYREHDSRIRPLEAIAE